MDVSIIIVNWKSAHYLQKCLESIYRDVSPLVFEVIVIDNASFDGCETMLAKQYPQVKFVQSAVNLGFARANNLAYRHSRGETLLFLNPDTEIIGQALSTMYHLLWENPNVGAIGCTLLNSDGTVQTSCIQSFPTILNQVLGAESLRRLFPLSPLWGIRPLFERREDPTPVEVVSGACLMVKRNVFECVGHFSIDYFMYAEETDLCYKMHLSKFVVYYTGAVSVIHHGGGSTNKLKRSYFADVAMHESLFRFLTKFRGCIYGHLYRVAIGGAAFVRIFLITSFMILALRKSVRFALQVSLGKWINIFRWSIKYG